MFFTTHITRSRLASALLGLLVATTPLLAADKPLRTPLGKPLPKNGPHTSIEAARGKLRDNLQQQIDEGDEKGDDDLSPGRLR